MRDDKWLEERLEQIWTLLFPELEKKNRVIVRFKGRWKNKFGHIKMLKNKNSEIVVNGFFKNEVVPEYIIDLTIAHELVHYMHGFNSPHPQQFAHPHQGGIVDKELRRRGFGENIMKEKVWMKETWPKIVKAHFEAPKPRKRRGFGFRLW